ncbi:unnamed protein product, partial [Brenthis ino]
MRLKMFWVIIMSVIASTNVYAQLTAQSSVAPELRECYTDPLLINRNNLPPMTMPVLIDIIQKIEDNPNINMDLRQLALSLLHTYRQDGIEFHQPDISVGISTSVLPYAPTFHSFHRNKLLLTRIITNNLQVLGNDTVNSALKCTLHHMFSTTVDARFRGDENSCNNFAQYRALRTIRDVAKLMRQDDVEIIDVSSLSSINKNGQMRQFNPKDDVEYTQLNNLKSERQVQGESACPILGGVVFTRWGAVSAGHVVAGIAGGAQFQNVPIANLAKGSIINNPNIKQTVSSIYVTTLSGDLAEAVLIQNTERGSPTITIGTAGNWNSTQAPRFYMLRSRLDVEMTDPETRGDIDGFVLGSLLNSDALSYNSMKLSQLLDMYYSPRNGVSDPSRRACNRKNLSTQLIDYNNLIEETYAFTAALDTNMPLRGTIIGGLQGPVNSAVTNFQNYITNSLNDINCEITETSSNDFRLKTNLFLVVDGAWQYQTIYPAISYLLDGVEVGKFGSSVTLLSANDGSVIINKTFSLADFHTAYTLSRHQSMSVGLNLESALRNIRTMMHTELENEKASNYVGGNSTVLLFLLSNTVQNNQLVREEARILNETVPDLRILFATSSNQFDNLWDLVRDMHNDIKTISLNSDGVNVVETMLPVLTSIQQVGRRIINPNCGALYPDISSGIRQFDDYVEPGYTNFYSISPNYFYGDNSNRRIRITRSSAGVGSLVICHSRVFAQPRQNSTISGQDENAVTCQTLASTGNIEINLQGACYGYWTINSCPFFHISVQSSLTNTASSLSTFCTESACRFPYNLRYQVQINEFGCYSGCSSVVVSAFLLICTFILTFL